jgi:HicB family
MPRKPTEMVQVNLRISENLRRRLERKAQKRGVSLNYEMTSRIEQGFDREAHRKIDKVASDLEDVWDRLVRDIDEQSRTQELISAAEHLIEKVRKGEAVDSAIEWVEKAVEAITRIHGRTYVNEPGEE